MRTYVRRWQYPVIVVLALATTTHAAKTTGAAESRDYAVRPVPFTAVKVDDVFWSPRMETNRAVTIPYDFKKCEETGRIDNFAKAGKLMDGPFRGTPFDDSDVFKVIEGASYSLSTHPDAELDKYLDGLIAKIAAAQEPDGYLYSARTIDPKTNPGFIGPTRWSNLKTSHELYNVGHMYEAAVAHFLATGKRSLLDVAIKNADLVCKTFGPATDQRKDPPGHQEIEMGLVKLYRATGQQKYLDQAKFFLDQRGRAEGHALRGPYQQDHKPVVEQDEAVGHAVRAAYMYSGMADVAALTGDAEYIKAIDRIWENVVGKKLYLTGGIGARHAGEAFGNDYELPNAAAYNETCAAIANALWNHRMFLLHADAKYLDVLERVIYNGFLSGVSLGGNEFFYPNPLASGANYKRSPWFGCACCPVNVVRFVPSIPGYIYAVDKDSLYVNLFVAGAAKVKVGESQVTLKQQTRYPWDGDVELSVNPEKESTFTLRVRIPGWARNEVVPGDLYHYDDGLTPAVKLSVNGEAQKLEMEKGFAVIKRIWKPGDTVRLGLPMPVRRIVAHEAIVDDRDCFAVERGPLVYCAEGADNDGKVRRRLMKGRLDFTVGTDGRTNGLEGTVAIQMKAAESGETLMLIPYYIWANRGPNEMTVFFRTKAQPFASSHCWGADSEDACFDGREPKKSNDHEIPRFTWWDHKGTTEWVERRFEQPQEISAASVYWFDDTPGGGCGLPASWRLLYLDGEQWKPVAAKGSYEVAKDRYCTVEFDPVKTAALRLEAKLQPKLSAGVLEWKLTVKAAEVGSNKRGNQPSPPAPLPQAGERSSRAVTIKAQPFKLSDVRLLEGSPFYENMIRDRDYLLSLDLDRLLHNFRVNVGLPSDAKPLGGWEEPKCELRGHSVGHYLSACALMYSATGDERFKQRVDKLVAEFAKCQAAAPAKGFNAGYLSAFPESFIDRVEPRKPVWAPWYTLHKIYAGLLDAHEHCGNKQALETMVKAADWIKFRVDRLSREAMQASLATEFGGMNEVLANLYAVTRNPDHLRLAQAFDHDAVFAPLAAGEDKLNGLHANTQIPKMIGAAVEYELTGDDRYRHIAEYFWHYVALDRSYCIGGHSDGEHFHPIEATSKHLSPVTAETCNTYNMLKLTRNVFGWSPQATTMDFYERALWNHILASQEPKQGMFIYFASLKPGHFKTYSTPNDSFWCCVGTGMENHARYGEAIYAHNDDTLWVNQFIPSELTWKEKGLTIRQETKFPESDTTTLAVKCPQSVFFTVAVRWPQWAAEGYEIKVNGQTIEFIGKPGSYIEIHRQWRDGDRIDVRLPMKLRLEATPDDPKTVAILYGPIVLAGELGKLDPDKVDPYAKKQQDLVRLAAPRVPAFVCEPAEFLKAIEPVPGEPLSFKTRGVGRPEDVTLKPFYQTHHERYTVYWKLMNDAEYEKHEAARAAAEKREQALAARTLDRVQPGDEASEKAHGFRGEKTGHGAFHDRAWRDARGGWFSYEVKAPTGPAVLQLTYWGSDFGRAFEIYLDNQKIATQKLENNKPGEFFDVEHALPAELTQNKQRVTIKLQALPNNTAGGLFELRLLRAE